MRLLGGKKKCGACGGRGWIWVFNPFPTAGKRKYSCLHCGGSGKRGRHV
jgi:hypothetical protein